MSKSFNELMEDYRILIWNAEDPTIKSVIEPFGYTTEKLEQGKTLYQEVLTLSETQRKEYAEQYTASSAFIEKRNEAQSALHRLRKITKFKFSANKESFNTLQLGTSLPSKFSNWLQAAKYFYQRLLEHSDWISDLAPFGYATESVTALQEALTELETLQESRLRESGDAQRATLARNAKFDELQAFCTELRNLAKLIFEDEDAQYLEKLGILARS